MLFGAQKVIMSLCRPAAHTRQCSWILAPSDRKGSSPDAFSIQTMLSVAQGREAHGPWLPWLSQAFSWYIEESGASWHNVHNIQKKAPDISKQVGYAKPVRFEHVLRNTRSICKIVIRFVLAPAQTIPNSGHDTTRKIKRLGGCRHGRCCGQRLRPGDTDRCSTCEKLRSVEVFRGETVDLWSRWTAGL